MTNSSDSRRWLEDAYRLATPEDNRAYYRRFAPAYDQEFVEALGYALPKAVADAYRREALPDDVPVADIGCGTGAVATHLGPGLAIDGFDISPEMLGVARGKNLYRALQAVDLAASLEGLSGGYGAVRGEGRVSVDVGDDRLQAIFEFAPHAGSSLRATP